MRKLTIIFMLLLGICNFAYAIKWDSKTNKAFRKASTYALYVDFSQAKIAGLDSAEFVTYYCEKEGKKPEFLGIVFKKFKQVLGENAGKALSKTFAVEDSSSADFIFDFKFSNITEKAGVNGVLMIYPKKHKDMAKMFSFKVKDGRWNDFDVLLLETAEKLGRRFALNNAYLQLDDAYVKINNPYAQIKE